jgi:cystathionine beta-lyase
MSFDILLNRRGTNCVKYDDLKYKFHTSDLDILPLWVADMDFNTPPFIVEAIKKRSEHEIYGYTRIDFSDEVINWQKRHNYEIKKDWIIPITSVVMGLNASIQSLSDVGDKVIVTPPIYPPFCTTIEAHKRQIASSPLVKTHSRFEFNLSSFDQNARLFFLSNPHNPAGRAWTRSELIQVGEFCLKNNICIISDEIHSDFIYSGAKHIPIASISKEFSDITITLNSASKTFNISGLGAAYAIISDQQLRQKFGDHVSQTHLYPTLFGALATKTAYAQGQIWHGELINYLEKNRDFVIEFIQTELPFIQVFKPEATYLLWLDFSTLTNTHQEIENLLLEKVKIALGNGLEFGAEKYFRLNLATSLENLKLAMNRLKNYFKC